MGITHHNYPGIMAIFVAIVVNIVVMGRCPQFVFKKYMEVVLIWPLTGHYQWRPICTVHHVHFGTLRFVVRLGVSFCPFVRSFASISSVNFILSFFFFLSSSFYLLLFFLIFVFFPFFCLLSFLSLSLLYLSFLSKTFQSFRLRHSVRIQKVNKERMLMMVAGGQSGWRLGVEILIIMDVQIIMNTT